MSPDNAWIVSLDSFKKALCTDLLSLTYSLILSQIIQGIETLSLRMERHCENALKVARHLEAHADVAWVRYPGLPSDPQYDKAQKYLKSTGKFTTLGCIAKTLIVMIFPHTICI